MRISSTLYSIDEPTLRDTLALLAGEERRHQDLRSYRFYRALADLHPGGEAKTMLLTIATEEVKHKEKIKHLYSNTAFPQMASG